MDDNYTMLADKLSAMCTGKVLRRVKDVYDTYVLLHIENYDYKRLKKTIELKRPGTVVKMGYPFKPDMYEDLMHAFNQFHGIVNKPDFEEVVRLVSKFLWLYLEIEDKHNYDYVWDSKELLWRQVSYTSME